MAYDASKPENDSFMADAPGTIRGNMEGIRTGQIVDAGTLKGLSPGNGTGNIPISNGTMNTNLNAEKVGGKTASEFAAVNHIHAVVTTSTDGPMSSTDKIKLNGIAAGAEVNQNSFSNILVGSTTIQADAKTDTLEIVAGTNIALTPDATNDRLTIGLTGTVAAATTAGTCTGNAATATNATGHIAAATSAHAASAIAFTPTGNISGANVQAAIAELDTEKQPIDATLTALAALITAADRLIYSTGVDTFALTTLTSFARTLLDDADAATARATLGAAPLASPALTGVPTAPTAAAGINTNQIATMAALQEAVSANVPTGTCRAWVNFNGRNGSVAIRASGNVSSVVRNGTGNYTVNFTTPMPHANYAVNVVASVAASYPETPGDIGRTTTSSGATTYTTSSIGITVGDNNTDNPVDAAYINVTIFC